MTEFSSLMAFVLFPSVSFFISPTCLSVYFCRLLSFNMTLAVQTLLASLRMKSRNFTPHFSPEKKILKLYYWETISTFAPIITSAACFQGIHESVRSWEGNTEIQHTRGGCLCFFLFFFFLNKTSLNHPCGSSKITYYVNE